MYLIERIRQIPFLRILIPFITGIYLEISLDIFRWWMFLLLPVTTVLLFFLSEKKLPGNYKFRSYFGFVCNIFLIICGMFAVFHEKKNHEPQNISNMNAIYTGYVYSVMQEENIYNKYLIDISENKYSPASGIVLLIMKNEKKKSIVKTGDRIIFSCRLSEITNNGNPCEFDYKGYMNRMGVYYCGFTNHSDIVVTAKAKKYHAKRYAKKLNAMILNKFHVSGISGNEYGVLSALLFGNKNNLEYDIRQAYIKSGSMHLLAVSGLHAGIIFWIFDGLLFFLAFNRTQQIIKTIIIISVLWCYAAMCGFPPSIFRASLMFSCFCMGKLINRNNSSLNSVCFSAFILLLANPFNASNPGFLLSYSAVTGIILFNPLLQNIFISNNIILSKIRALVTVSISAFAGTFPLSIYYFHQIPVYFIFSNIILIPFTFLMLALIVPAAVFPPFHDFYFFIIKIINSGISFMNSSVMFIEQLPFSTIQNIYIDKIQMIFLFILMLSLYSYINDKHIKSLVSLLIIAVLIISLNIFHYTNTISKNIITVFNIKGITAINFINKQNNIVVTNPLTSETKKKIEYSGCNYWISLNAKNNLRYIGIDNLNTTHPIFSYRFLNNSHIISCGNKRILWLNEPLPKEIHSKEQLKADIIIVSCFVKPERIKSLFNFNTVILSSSLPVSTAENMAKEFQRKNIKTHSVAHKGAYVIYL